MIVQINLMHILRARLNGLQGRIQLGHHPVIIGIQGKIAQKMGIGIYGQGGAVDAAQIVHQIGGSLINQPYIFIHRLLLHGLPGMRKRNVKR